jgi:tetratricopeptide (TPR) repeat protein
VFDHIKAESYQQAISCLDVLLEKNPNYIQALTTKARCFLALDKKQKAIQTYDSLLMLQKDESLQYESALVKGHNPGFPPFEKLKNGNALFLNALYTYMQGKIITTIKSLKKAIELHFDWETQESLDLLVGFLLQENEFTDFEQIYLDVEEATCENNPHPQNRWFSLSLPVHDFFAATSDTIRQEKAKKFFDLISPAALHHPLDGRKELESILKDFLRDQEDARFGLEALRCLQNNDIEKLAELLLALMLEHLMRFSNSFDLEKKEMKNKQLADLVVLLPQKLSLALLFMFTVSRQKEAYQQNSGKKYQDQLLNMLTLCFVTFYHQIGIYDQQDDHS